MALAPFIQRLNKKDNLSREDAREAFDAIFEGKASDQEMAEFLVQLKEKGETVDELWGAVTSMRSRMVSISAPRGTMDIVGTGGDTHSTLNISTAVAFVVAGCGVPVAKHGNRAASSRSGSSDVLAALGINLVATPSILEQCLHEAKICFMFAPHHHPAMKNVAALRQKLKTRTIFNLLGPLTNPANVKRHLIGVFARDWLEPMAQVLDQLGSEVAWFTHGQDGMDEISTTAPTDVVELRNHRLDRMILEPEMVGLPRARIEVLKGGEAEHNAVELKRLLQGQRGTYRDIVLFNAAAALIVADKTDDLNQGIKLAEQSLDDGAARAALEKLIVLTNEKRV